MTKHDLFTELDDHQNTKEPQSIKKMMLENDHYNPQKQSKLSFGIFITLLLFTIFIIGSFII